MSRKCEINKNFNIFTAKPILSSINVYNFWGERNNIESFNKFYMFQIFLRN